MLVSDVQPENASLAMLVRFGKLTDTSLVQFSNAFSLIDVTFGMYTADMHESLNVLSFTTVILLNFASESEDLVNAYFPIDVILLASMLSSYVNALQP